MQHIKLTHLSTESHSTTGINRNTQQDEVHKKPECSLEQIQQNEGEQGILKCESDQDPIVSTDRQKVRKDMNGNEIVKGDKHHCVTFRDRVNSDQLLYDVHMVSKHNAHFQSRNAQNQSQCCVIF